MHKRVLSVLTAAAITAGVGMPAVDELEHVATCEQFNIRVMAQPWQRHTQSFTEQETRQSAV